MITASLLALVLLAGTLPLLAALRQPGINTSDDLIEDFNQGALIEPSRLIAADGFRSGDMGWYLDPGASGRFVYEIRGRPGSNIGVNLWVYSLQGVTDSVSVSAPGLPLVEIASNVDYAGTGLALPPRYVNASRLDVQIDARNGGPTQQLVIDQIESYTFTGAEPTAPPLYTYAAFGALVGLFAFLLLRHRPKAALVAIGIGLISMAATAVRVIALVQVRLPPDPDAIAYKAYAERFSWWPLFDNGIFSGNFSEREPLFPMVAHIYFQLLGPSDFHLRVVSTTLSIAVVIVTVVAARRRLQSWWAPLLVGATVAASGPLIDEAKRGLRLELETLVILALYLALDRQPSRRPFLDAIVVGLIGAAMALTRTYLIPVFIVAVIISFLIRYRSWRRAAALVAIAVVIMGGAEAAHRVGLYEHKQNAFWDTAGYLRWNANQELFRFHRPLPHPELFPSLSQYQTQGTYSGPGISSYQYFFEIHSPLEFARDSLAGSREIFDTIDPATVDVGALTRLHRFPARLVSFAGALAQRFDDALRWIVLVGLLAMIARSWREPRLLIVPAIAFSWLAMTAFLFDHQLIERYRHTWQTYPLVLIAGAWLFETAFILVRRRVRIAALMTLDAALTAAALILIVAAKFIPASAQAPDALVAAAAVALLSYRRPAWGLGATLLAASVATGLLGTAAAVASLAGVVARGPHAIRALLPLLSLLPLAALIVFTGGHPSTGAVELATSMVAATGMVAVAYRDERARQELLWLLAATGPIAGVAYFAQPSAPFAVELVPVGAVAGTWLYLHGRRWALPLALLDAGLVLVVLPFAAWLAVAVAVGWLLVRQGALVSVRRRLLVAGAVTAGLTVLASGAALAGTTPSPDAAWSERLTTPASSIEQVITVDRPGDTSIWIYARRGSALPDYPFAVSVNASPVTTDLNSFLLTGPMAWARIPLPDSPRVGDRLDVRIEPGGSPDAVDRFIEVGGVFAKADGLVSSGVDGTWLIVLGDDGTPLAPGALPEPMVRNPLHLPMGEWMPGELRWAADSRADASALEIWRQTLTIAATNPGGVGTGMLSGSLSQGQSGLGPGLSARDEFLQAGAEWGLAGLVGLLLALAAAAWLSRRSGDPLAGGLLVLTVITMVGESILTDAASAMTLWLALGFCFGATALSGASPTISPASDGEMRRATSPPTATRAG